MRQTNKIKQQYDKSIRTQQQAPKRQINKTNNNKNNQ